MRLDVDGDDRVAIAARAGLALAGEADPASLLDRLWKLDVDGLAARKGGALRLERRSILEGNRKTIGDVGALLGRRLAGPASPETAKAAAALPAAGAAEQAFENVRKIDLLASPELPSAGAAPEAAGARMSAGAEAERRLGIAFLVYLAPVILGPLGLVRQDVVGAGDRRKALRGLGIVLVLVGMKLLGELAIGLLDLGLARVALDAQL
jgi:hypothetical protein